MTERYAPHIEALAAFASELSAAATPPDVLDRARRIFADCVGCIVAGNRAPEMRALAAIERGRGRIGEASVLGISAALPRETASAVNGAAGTWLDLDEGNLHTKGHPGIQIVPAAFAEAESGALPGADLLRALVAGYEVGCRVYGATTARLAVHPHGTFGPLAAAVALGCLRGADTPAMARIIAIAATLGVPASRRTLADGATVRNAYTAASGRAAFQALDLAEAGFTGERDPLASVFGTIYGEAFDAAACVTGLGTEWKMLRNYFKLYPSVRYAHSAIDLIDDISAHHGAKLDADAIERIAVDTYFMATSVGSATVTSAFGTRFSLPFAVASHILGADADIADDGSAAFARADVHALARRVEVGEIPAFTQAYPARQRSAMRVHLTDGRMLEARADYIRGEAETPHSDAAMRAKFLALTASSWGDAARTACDAAMAIDAVPDVAALAGEWRRAAKACGS